MYLLSSENRRLVGFETLLAQAMSTASVALPADGFSAALAAQFSSYSPPVYEDAGDDGTLLAASAPLSE